MKNTLFVSIIVLCSFDLFCQSSGINFFEIHTKRAYTSSSSRPVSFNKDSIIARINSMPDSAAMDANFLVSIDNESAIDSIFFILKNSNNLVVLNKGEKLSQLLSSGKAKLLNGTLSYPQGPFPYLKRFVATARFRYTNGTSSATKTFDK